MIDRQVQRTQTYSGIPSVFAQDQGVQESMGPIYDRSKEHLATADLGIIAARRAFLRAAKELRDDGTTPPGVFKPEMYRLRGANKLLPKDETSWVEAMRDWYTARPGVNLPMP
jgi:hypothetical protein